MADKKEREFSLEQELKDATLRLSQFEQQIQSGEIDLSDEEAKSRRIEKERAKKLVKYRSDVQQIISRPDGRRVMWRILEIAGPNRISHTPGDPYSTAVNEGKRIVANEILLMLFDADQDVYAKMQRENLSDLKADAERRKKEMKELEELNK